MIDNTEVVLTGVIEKVFQGGTLSFPLCSVLLRMTYEQRTATGTVERNTYFMCECGTNIEEQKKQLGKMVESRVEFVGDLRGNKYTQRNSGDPGVFASMRFKEYKLAQTPTTEVDIPF